MKIPYSIVVVLALMSMWLALPTTAAPPG
ncbi:hypothetical protein LCGC14_2552410, partial [marine sediment metagenome]